MVISLGNDQWLTHAYRRSKALAEGTATCKLGGPTPYLLLHSGQFSLESGPVKSTQEAYVGQL